MKKALRFLLILFISFQLSGCYVSQYSVGSGGAYEGKDMKLYDVKKKHWYLFWGAMPLDDVNSNSVAGGAENYSVRETFSFGDMVLRGITLGIAGPKTIRISKGENEAK